MCADTENTFCPAWIRAVKRQILTDAKLRGSNPPRFLAKMREYFCKMRECYYP